jgi:protein-S-isoprenylcysteine O-methyltransferase Ste14
MRSRSLPDLGPHGEGWLLIQLGLFGVIAAAGGAGPLWGGQLRLASSVTGAALIAAGGFLSMRGVIDLGANLTPFPKPLDRAELVECGAYRLARHPIYGGLIVAASGWGLAMASPLAIAAALLLGVFFDLKSRREEGWLAEKYRGYEAYRRRTRRLIPWLY